MLGLERGAALVAAPFKPCPEGRLCPALAGAAADAEEEEEEDDEAEEEEEAASSGPSLKGGGSCWISKTLLLARVSCPVCLTAAVVDAGELA